MSTPPFLQLQERALAHIQACGTAWTIPHVPFERWLLLEKPAFMGSAEFGGDLVVTALVRQLQSRRYPDPNLPFRKTVVSVLVSNEILFAILEQLDFVTSTYSKEEANTFEIVLEIIALYDGETARNWVQTIFGPLLDELTTASLEISFDSSTAAPADEPSSKRHKLSSCADEDSSPSFFSPPTLSSPTVPQVLSPIENVTDLSPPSAASPTHSARFNPEPTVNSSPSSGQPRNARDNGCLRDATNGLTTSSSHTRAISPPCFATLSQNPNRGFDPTFDRRHWQEATEHAMEENGRKRRRDEDCGTSGGDWRFERRDEDDHRVKRDSEREAANRNRHQPDRREHSPDRRSRSPDRRDYSQDRHGRSRDRHDRSRDRRGRSRDRREPSRERPEPSRDRVNRRNQSRERERLERREHRRHRDRSCERDWDGERERDRKHGDHCQGREQARRRVGGTTERVQRRKRDGKENRSPRDEDRSRRRHHSCARW